ncbi:MAG: PucR family transcriptional regulator [Actinophytocola sp.]|nr:PucR family transcriptional regulator [Actinophytocola sp.]
MTAEPEDETWLSRAADSASSLAGGVPKEFLGDYLLLLAEAATHGRRPRRAELEAVGVLGRRAADSGVSAGQAVSLYLSAARQVWGELPMVVRARDSAAVRAAADAVLQVIDDAVAVFADGHAQAVRERVRREEMLRRELIEDLLRGDAHLGELVERAEPFGLDLTRTHQVALAAPGRRLPDIEAAASTLERIVLDRFGDRDALVATKEGQVVVLVPAEPPAASRARSHQGAATGIGRILHAELDRLRRGRPWRIAVGRPHPGAYGIARSYEEAREGLSMAARLQMDRPVIEAEDMLIYRVLVRDQPAIADLVHTVLGPLAQARGGAAALLDTLEAYFAMGGIATQAAARLHLSVRAVTYRLARVKALTGYNPADPTQRFTVHAAVLGARALGWPGHELSQPNASGQTGPTGANTGDTDG